MPYRKVGALEACWYMIRYKLKETFMPRIPDHPCSHPGCPRLVPRGRKYCNEHAGLHPEEVRSAFSRGYDRKWQRVSKAFLRSHPLNVSATVGMSLQQWLITSFPIAEIRSCSGTRATGSRCASGAMIRKPAVRTAIPHITTDGRPPGGGQISKNSFPADRGPLTCEKKAKPKG